MAKSDKETTRIPEVVSFDAGVDIGSTESRLILEGLDENGNVVGTSKTIILPSEVGIVKEDIVAKMAVQGAKTLKQTYDILTIGGSEVQKYWNSVRVAYPTKMGAITNDSFTALERVLDDLFKDVVAHKQTIAAGIGVPTDYAQSQYRDIVTRRILPRVINKNGKDDNWGIITDEACFEAAAIRTKANDATIANKIDLARLCIVSIGGGTTNLYIADGATPHEGNAHSYGFAGRELVSRFMNYVQENKLGKINAAHAEKIISGTLAQEAQFKDYKNVRARLTGYDAPAKVPPMMAPIDVDGHYRPRNIGPAMDRAVRDLFEETRTQLLGLLKRYEGHVKPVTFVLTGRAGQIEGLDTALEEALHRANEYEARVYNLSAFKDEAGQEIFTPNLLVAQGALATIHVAEKDPRYNRHYIRPE